MGNFEMRYPVHGSAALKPSSAEKSQSATIIEFPAIAQRARLGVSQTEQHSGTVFGFLSAQSALHHAAR